MKDSAASRRVFAWTRNASVMAPRSCSAMGSVDLLRLSRGIPETLCLDPSTRRFRRLLLGPSTPGLSLPLAALSVAGCAFSSASGEGAPSEGLWVGLCDGASSSRPSRRRLVKSRLPRSSDASLFVGSLRRPASGCLSPLLLDQKLNTRGTNPEEPSALAPDFSSSTLRPDAPPESPDVEADGCELSSEAKLRVRSPRGAKFGDRGSGLGLIFVVKRSVTFTAR
mmetsp:Transcript_11667/g.35402  ORF Transcript_11667/g.35402 Transcript_11667/m.35402 type:complete len:224 (+) Transcript_11667:144-815(+)